MHRSRQARTGTSLGFLDSHPQRRFERHVRKYQHRIFGFAVYFLGDRTEAEDVTQDVLLRLWQHRDSVDEDRLLGWLLRVTRNACVDALRKRKAQRNVMTSDTDALAYMPGKGPTPDACAEAADFQDNRCFSASFSQGIAHSVHKILHLRHQGVSAKIVVNNFNTKFRKNFSDFNF